MNQEQIMEAMSYIDPALIEAADQSLSANRRVRWTRPAVIAACLCVVLAGTALAAELSGVRIVELFNNETRVLYEEEGEKIYSGYSVSGGVEGFTPDDLPSEALELLGDASQNVGKSFRSWEAMEEFLGVDLMDNPVLETASPGWKIQWDWVSGRYLLHFFTCHNALTQIYVEGSYIFYPGQGEDEQEVNIKVRGTLYSTIEESEHSIYYEGGADLSQEEYVTPNGLTAQIIRADIPQRTATMYIGPEETLPVPPCTAYNAVFSLNGIQYEVSTDSSAFDPVDAETLRATLLEVLDGFVVEPTE